MRSTSSCLFIGKSQSASSRSILLLTAIVALGGPHTARGEPPSDPYAQISLTTTRIQGGSPITLTGFSTAAALPRVAWPVTCGLNTIVKQVDTEISPQFFSLLSTKTQIPSMLITLTQSFLPDQIIYHEINLTNVHVVGITRSDYYTPLYAGNSLAPAPPVGYLYETITLQATAFTYTYQPITPTGQPLGPPSSVSGNCETEVSPAQP